MLDMILGRGVRVGRVGVGIVEESLVSITPWEWLAADSKMIVCHVLGLVVLVVAYDVRTRTQLIIQPKKFTFVRYSMTGKPT